ncbi:MAG: metal ABC transporter ATP-binding protein [Patescibacteria group bacterium]|jgi:zinc transport system ATP-binding protein
MIALSNYHVLVGGRTLVGPLAVTLRAGELLAVTGPNGAGKTQFIRGLLGLNATEGEFLYEGKAVDRVPAADVGYVPQRFHFPGTLPLTVREFFGLSSVRRPTRALCSELKIQELFDASLATLSGGELQRVVLARALARSPKLLVLDEASAGIDALGRTEIASLLVHLLKEHDTTIITVTHDHAELTTYEKRLGKKFHELRLGDPHGHTH